MNFFFFPYSLPLFSSLSSRFSSPSSSFLKPDLPPDPFLTLKLFNSLPFPSLSLKPPNQQLIRGYDSFQFLALSSRSISLSLSEAPSGAPNQQQPLLKRQLPFVAAKPLLRLLRRPPTEATRGYLGQISVGYLWIVCEL